MSRRTAKLLYILTIIAMIVLMVVLANHRTAMVIVAVVAAGIAILLNHKLRCPHCGAWPRKGSLFHRCCPRCGEPLDD